MEIPFSQSEVRYWHRLVAVTIPGYVGGARGSGAGDVVQWSRGYSGTAGCMAGLDGLKGLFQS